MRVFTSAEVPLFLAAFVDVSVGAGKLKEISVQFHQIVSALQQVTVTASAPSSLSPIHPKASSAHDRALDANQGRPGTPISIPALPIETAPGGIKAPQYFAPGVAGDDGEPIAQFDW